MALIQCIYSSAATDKNFSSDDLAELLEISRLNNAVLGISGILLFENGSFFQILEGEAESVDVMFQKLHGDSRHHSVSLIASEPIARRSFSEWSMGYPTISMAEIESLPGLNDFFAHKRSFVDVQNESARMFLDAFRNGDWHIR